MLRRILLATLSGFLMFAANTANAGTNDHVVHILTCGPNVVMIEMQNNGYVYASVPAIGTQQATAIVIMANALMLSGHAARYFYTPGSATLVCGVQAREIDNLGMSDPVVS